MGTVETVEPLKTCNCIEPAQEDVRSEQARLRGDGGRKLTLECVVNERRVHCQPLLVARIDKEGVARSHQRGKLARRRPAAIAEGAVCQRMLKVRCHVVVRFVPVCLHQRHRLRREDFFSFFSVVSAF